MRKIDTKKIKVLITGGHLTPAIAVIEQMKKDVIWDIYFIGRKSTELGSKILSQEVEQIPKLGVNFYTLSTGKLPRHFSLKTLLSIAQIPVGFVKAYKLVKDISPDIMLLFGGYLALPIAFSGRLLNIPIVMHEQTITKGLANEIIEKFASTIAVSWEESQNHFNKKVYLTGNPIREVIVNGPGKIIPISSDKLPIIYITGGNQGSKKLNEITAEIIFRLTKKFNVVHQCGYGKKGSGLTMLNTIRENLPEIQQNRYLIKRWFTDAEVAWILRHADLVVSRSGANVVSELALIGTKSLLIPLQISARNEQFKNALLLKTAGTAEIIEEKAADSASLYEKILEMQKNDDKYKSNLANVKNLVIKNASEKLTQLVQAAYEESKKNN